MRVGRPCLAILLSSALGADAAPTADCATQAETLSREKTELPRVDVASPADRPPYCITLETVMAYASRLRAHVAACPHSAHAESIAEWERIRADYSKLFNQHRCKSTS
jgi:hypothetical protein